MCREFEPSRKKKNLFDFGFELDWSIQSCWSSLLPVLGQFTKLLLWLLETTVTTGQHPLSKWPMSTFFHHMQELAQPLQTTTKQTIGMSTWRGSQCNSHPANGIRACPSQDNITWNWITFSFCAMQWQLESFLFSSELQLPTQRRHESRNGTASLTGPTVSHHFTRRECVRWQTELHSDSKVYKEPI